MKPLILSAAVIGTSLVTAALVPTLPSRGPLGHTQHSITTTSTAITKAEPQLKSPGVAAFVGTVRCWHWRNGDAASRVGGNCLSAVQNPLLRPLVF